VKSKKGDVEVSVDEEYKGLKIEKVPTLKPVFKYLTLLSVSDEQKKWDSHRCECLCDQ